MTMSDSNQFDEEQAVDDEDTPSAAHDAAIDAAADEAAASILDLEDFGDDDDDEFGDGDDDGIYSEEEAALLIAQAEAAELKDKLLRAVAETENVRRRAKRDVDDARKFSVTDFARDMLQVSDNMRRAIDAVPAEVRATHPEVVSLLEGVEITDKGLIGTLERHGISAVDPMGEKLDPNLHQAVLQIENPDAAPGTVVQVMQVGYTLHGRLLRPAMVAVAK